MARVLLALHFDFATLDRATRRSGERNWPAGRAHAPIGRPNKGEVMDSTTLMVIVVALLLLGAITWVLLKRRRTGELKHRFGHEYDRLVREQGGTRKAEKELEHRTKRVKRLSIRPIPAAEQTRYAELWRAQQARFVDDPKAAVTEADRLVEEVMEVRGYPVGDFERQAEDISVDHPREVQNYRAAHEIAVRHKRGQATTEDLRNAMVCYRALFEGLLDDRPALAEARR